MGVSAVLIPAKAYPIADMRSSIRTLQDIENFKPDDGGSELDTTSNRQGCRSFKRGYYNAYPCQG